MQDSTVGLIGRASSLLPAPFYVVRGAFFIWTHRVLWKYAAAPIAISAAILTTSYVLVYFLVSRFARPYQGEYSYGKVVYYVLVVATSIAILVIFFFFFSRLASAVASPFNELISLRTEELVTGVAQDAPFSIEALLRDSVRTVVHSLGILALYIGLLIVALVLLLIPVIGGISYTFAGVLLSSYLFAYEHLGYSMDRRLYSWTEKQAFLRSRVRSVIGFGLGVLIVSMVPVVNIFAIPAAAVGGTLLYLDLNPQAASVSEPASPEPQ